LLRDFVATQHDRPFYDDRPHPVVHTNHFVSFGIVPLQLDGTWTAVHDTA
jgi:hypothetical protein